MAKVVREKLTESKNKIKGVFYLSDKSKTNFEICKKEKQWYQWGNTNQNMFLTVSKVEEMFNRKIYQND